MSRYNPICIYLIKSINLYIITILLFIIIASIKSYSMGEEVINLIPDKINGWKGSEISIYDRKTIFDYINGAGEVYLSYNFNKVFVRRFVKSNEPEIVVDMFEMGNSKNAFGVFSFEQGLGSNVNIGQDSEYIKGSLRFWKDNFFVSIYSIKETKESNKAIIDLGKAIAKNIKKQGKKPEILNYLPDDKLIKKSIHYFYKHPSLNYHYFVADENILYLGTNTEGVLAQYKSDKKTYLLLIKYPNIKQSKSAYNNFIKYYLPDAKKTGIAKTEQGRWTEIKVFKKWIIIVFDSFNPEISSDLIRSIIERLKKQ